MYNRQKGELKYSPELGYYYEADLEKHKKYKNIQKISLIVTALILMATGIYWLLNQKKSKELQTPPTQIHTPTTQPKPLQVQEEKNATSPLQTQPIPSTPLPNEINTTQESNTTIDANPKVENNDTQTKANPSEANSSEVTFDRGDNKLFFTSMGKSVEGAVIKKNVEEIHLEIDDTKAKEEIKNEQLNNGIIPPKEKNTKEKPKTQENKTPTPPKSITVKSGDNIYSISKRVYGDSQFYKKILQANKIKNIRSLKIGQKLIIPPKD